MTELPDEDGWYWWKAHSDFPIKDAEVVQKDGYVFYHGDHRLNADDMRDTFKGGEWLRIPSPEEVAALRARVKELELIIAGDTL